MSIFCQISIFANFTVMDELHNHLNTDSTLLMKPLFLDAAIVDQMSNIQKKTYGYKLKLVSAVIEHNGLTNADICRYLDISSPKSLALINELITEGILEQNEKGSSIGGRKPVLNKVKDQTLIVLCIEVERFAVKITLLDNNNNKLSDTKLYPFLLTKDRTSVKKLRQLMNTYIEQSCVAAAKISAIGIGMPGLINYKEGNNYTYMMEDSDKTSLQEHISGFFNKPVFIVNDVKSSAIAELKFGLAKNKKDVLVILMDWGIGLGVIMDGKLRQGTAGYSGEMGHMPFVEDGALCYCGKKGCLETVASGIALARMAKEGIQSGQESLLNKLSDQEIDKIVPQLVIDAANQGDQYAINILSYLGERLGKGISVLIQVLNPELIILAGKIAEAKQYITIPIMQAINTYCMAPLRDQAKVALSPLGPDGSTMGIARVTLDALFNSHIEDV